MKKLLAFIAALLVLGCAVYADVTVKDLGNGNAEVTFFYGNPKATEVVIAGTWTDWQNGALPMTKVEKGWEYKITVPYATQMKYKFISDGNWTFDLKAPDKVDDGFGAFNGLVDVAAIIANSKPAAASAAPAAGKANIKFITWTMLGAQAKFLTQGAVDPTTKGFDIDNVSLGAKSYAKFTGEFLPNMPFYVELAIAEKNLGDITLMQKNGAGDYTTKLYDGVKGLGNGLLTNPVAYLSGADNNSGTTKGPGSNPFLGHLKFGLNTPYINWMSYFNYAKPLAHQAIIWTTIDGAHWDAGYEHVGGITEFSNGSAIQQFGDLKINATFAPNKDADRKGNMYGLYTYATAEYQAFKADVQFNGMYSGKYIFETPVERDIIAGFKGTVGPVNFAAQGLVAFQDKDFTSGAADYFGYSTDVFYRQKDFNLRKDSAIDVKAAYTGSKVYGADLEYKLRGVYASMLYVREDHDDTAWTLSDQLGVVNSQNIILNAFVKPVEFLNVALNTTAKLQNEKLSAADCAAIDGARESWYPDDDYPVIGMKSGAEFSFKPDVTVDLAKLTGLKASVDAYTTVKYTNFKTDFTNETVKYDESDAQTLLKNVGVKYSMKDVSDVVKGLDVYYGFDNSDSTLLFNTLIASVKLPMDINADLGLGLRSVKSTDAGDAYDADLLNPFGFSLGVAKKLVHAFHPTAYAQFVYNMDPYKEFGDGQDLLNLDGYVTDDGVSDFNGAAAVRVGIRWDL